MRSRILLAGLLAAAALPAGVAQAAPPSLFSAYDLHGDRAASYSVIPAAATLGVEGEPTFADADVGGVVRPVGRTAPGSGFVATATSAYLTGVYTIALAVDVEDEWVEQRILSLRGKTSAVGLYLREGKLEYRGTSATTRSEQTFPADFATVVLTRDADHLVSVYVDGVLHLSLTDAAADGQVASVRVGNVDAEGDGALDLARLRIGRNAAMTAAEVAALGAYDTAGPVAETDSPEVIDGVRHAGPTAQWRLLLADDGSGPGLTVTSRVETRAGALVPGTSETATSVRAMFGGDSLLDRVKSTVFRDTLGTLVDGAEYDMVVTATDRFGHAGTTRLPFVADTQAPGVTIDAPPARVTSHTPSFSGAGGSTARDYDWVELAICDGDGCANERRGGVLGNELAWGSAQVIDGRWTSEPMTMEDPETGEPLPLPDGRYTLVARQWDRAGNERVVERRFEIGAPLPVEEQPGGVEQPAGEPASPPASPAPPAPAPAPAPQPGPAPAPRSSTSTPSPLDAVVRALSAKGLKGLGRGVRVDVAGTVTVLDAKKRRTLARGTRTIKLTSAGRKALRGRKRLTVVVRVGARERRVTLTR